MTQPSSCTATGAASNTPPETGKDSTPPSPASNKSTGNWTAPLETATEQLISELLNRPPHLHDAGHQHDTVHPLTSAHEPPGRRP
ncbi:hypothetical protein LV779_18285 [Streptomyces thinghirensis]|nr:hypothetical protein [Streptomyces thinghirensis]